MSSVTTSTVLSNIPYLYCLFMQSIAKNSFCMPENREKKCSKIFWLSEFHEMHIRTSAVESAVLPFPKAIFSFWSCYLLQLVVFGKLGLKWLKYFGIRDKRILPPFY